jgi:hypothetical protein
MLGASAAAELPAVEDLLDWIDHVQPLSRV